MSVVKCLVVGLFAVIGLTACDHSSTRNAAQPFTPHQVRQAFAAAGIHLDPSIRLAGSFGRDLEAMLGGNGGIEVAVYKTTRPRGVLVGWTGLQPPAIQSSRNIVVIYPKQSRLLPSIRRALVLLSQEHPPPAKA